MLRGAWASHQAAMKRSQDFSPASPPSASPVQKKLKMSPPVSHGLSMQGSLDDTAASENGWTKVEKRKAKKLRRTEVKLDVCVSVQAYSRRYL